MNYSIKFYRGIKNTVANAFKLVYQPKVKGKEFLKEEESFILAGNHTSLLDLPLLVGCIDDEVRFMAKQELFDTKLTNYFFTKMGAFPVNRDNPSPKTIITALRILKNNEILGVFPEGTRNKTDELLPFKPGVIAIAKKANKKIIPFGISGEYKIGGGINLEFASPMDVSDMALDEACELLREKVKILIK